MIEVDDTRRPEEDGHERPLRPAARDRVAFAVAWVAVLAAWAATRSLPFVSGFAMVLLGTTALLLTTFDASEWRAAAAGQPLFWEAAARAAWTSGATCAVALFEAVLLGPSQGLAAAARQLALSFVPVLYGGALAAGLLMRMARLAAVASGPQPAADSTRAAGPDDLVPGSAGDRAMGRALFVVLAALPVVVAVARTGPSRIAESLQVLHVPAVLVLLGVVVAARAVGGAPLRRQSGSAVLAGAGTLTALAGLVHALLGIADLDITAISSGLNFQLTACILTLGGLAVATLPNDDRRRRMHLERGPRIGSTIAWVVFPLFAVMLLAVAYLMILTPMTRPV